MTESFNTKVGPAAKACLAIAFLCLSTFSAFANTNSNDVFIRFKVNQPVSENVLVLMNAYFHAEPWRSPHIRTQLSSGTWSQWIDISSWKWHSKHNRSGGYAEYPAIGLRAHNSANPVNDFKASFSVEIADAPRSSSVIHSFEESGEGTSIIFLTPYPLREKRAEFETGRQIVSRHALWAKEAVGKNPINIKNFVIATNIGLRPFPGLEESEVATLRSMGFNSIGGIGYPLMKKYGVSTFETSWSLQPDPEVIETAWQTGYLKRYQQALAKPFEQLRYDNFSYFAVSDEVKAVDFRRADKKKLDGWFQTYLRKNTSTANLDEGSLDSVEYPLEALFAPRLDRDSRLSNRRLLYNAARFGQIWSADRLKQAGANLNTLFPNTPISTLIPSHGFFGNAWGPNKIGMSYRMMDLFEIGRKRAVDQIAVEDWFGLNHMYGPSYTWSGAQSFGYYNAIARSAMPKDVLLRGFLTPSDDKYLRLKAYSSLGQGAKSLYFWSYGPTLTATENYWSDLKSEYQGVVKINRAIEKTEDVLLQGETATDPVAILYSVSHDIWSPDLQSAFVEKRLLWHALRHEQIQPQFIDETGVTDGGLKNYKVLYLTDTAISKESGEKIDDWVKRGGVLYLSAGAATRDEYFSDYLPGFAKAVWRAGSYTPQPGTFNERTTLKSEKPLTTANIKMESGSFVLPVLGGRSKIITGEDSFGEFADGEQAGRIVEYGKGKIVAVAFMPMLAYGRLANFQPATLEEQWQPEARRIISIPLEIGAIDPVAKSNIPVVETNLLKGKSGYAVVLANYTYKPIERLQVAIKTDRKFSSAVSTEGKPVKILSQKNGEIVIELSFEWTDIVILK